ncbi:MAG: toll/interleukin-1 receptor domain-containing protein [Zoogloea sp.]|uniref:toll/interleukin-1 receptor domain-containing protein n=1 Tax=Zoogloea sp. TaxID=49181 RepID=UPI003F397191
MFYQCKHNVAPDEPWVQRLHQTLLEAGHDVFIDTTMLVGESWVERIQQEVSG